VKTLILLTSLNLPTSTDFLKPPFTHGCANPSRMFSSSTGFIRLLWRHIRQNVVCPAPLSRLRSVTSIPPQYAYMLLRSYYFYQRCLLSSVVKSSEGRPPYRLSGKNQGFAQVRGLQASACFRQRFSPLIGCSIGAEPKLFLWNSLIKPPRVGDAFKGMVAWDFSVFQKV
jgi:hypothetical protein